MNLPDLSGFGSKLANVGDFLSLERKSNGVVAKAQVGDVKYSKMLYESTGRVVETKSYKIK